MKPQTSITSTHGCYSLTHWFQIGARRWLILSVQDKKHGIRTSLNQRTELHDEERAAERDSSKKNKKETRRFVLCSFSFGQKSPQTSCQQELNGFSLHLKLR